MSAPFSRTRRIAAAAVALAFAALLFRGELAQALIIRGDDYMYRHDTTQALERYRRALDLIPSSETAADRLVFIGMQRRTKQSLRASIGIATRFLLLKRDDATLLTDRALCYLHDRDYVRAERDFEHAASKSKRPADYVFAGFAARRTGDRARARLLWRAALALHPGYRPAMLALAEHRP